MFQGLFIDGFAGGGGASTGIAQAIGRDVDIAINHSPTAIAIHKANHPTTEHHCQDIRIVWPTAATKMQPVAGAWFSPDCKEHSKAKGGPVKDRNIRQLPWEIVPWLKETRPTVGYVENVEEMQLWGPLDEHGHVIRELRGKEFQRWIRAIRALGYRVQWCELRACDYGAPTSRKRLYIVMRCDGLPIVWPKPTHGRPESPGVRSGRLLPYRTAAECIDWSIPCPSIFDRKRPLKDATLRRIAHGVMRYVVNAERPFIVGTAFTNTRASRVFDPDEPLRTSTTQAEYGLVDAAIIPVTHSQNSPRAHSTREPLRTITTANGGEFALAGATMVQTGWGEREGQAPRALDVGKPLGTIMADGNKHAAVTAFLSSFYSQGSNNREVGRPHPTVMAESGKSAVVTAHIEQANGGPRNQNSAGRDARRPLSTATTTGSQQRIVETTLVEEGALPPEMLERAVKVAAFLVKYYGTNSENEVAQIQAVDRPLDTVTTRARFAVVTVTIDAVTYVVVDIGLRMLKPRELARAQGFPESYVLDPIVRKFLRGKWVARPLTIAEQISAIGNSVCPPMAHALVSANQPGLPEMRMAA